MGEGGISGLGLGEGREKLMYMPFAHTDFIFPMTINFFFSRKKGNP